MAAATTAAATAETAPASVALHRATPGPPADSYLKLIHNPLRCALDTPHPGIIFDFVAVQGHAVVAKQYILVDIQLQVFASDVNGGPLRWRNYAKRSWRSVDYVRGKTHFPTRAQAAVRFAVSSPDEVAGQRLRGVIKVRWRNNKAHLPDTTFWQGQFTTGSRTCTSGWNARSAAARSPRSTGGLSSLPAELRPRHCVVSGDNSETSKAGRLDTTTDWEYLTVVAGEKSYSLSDITWTPRSVEPFDQRSALSVPQGTCTAIGALSGLGSVTLTHQYMYGDSGPYDETFSYPSRAKTNFVVARSIDGSDPLYFDTQRVISAVYPFVSASCPRSTCLLVGTAEVVVFTGTTSKTLAKSDVRVTLAAGTTRFRWPLSAAAKRAVKAHLTAGVTVYFSGTIAGRTFRDYATFRR